MPPNTPRLVREPERLAITGIPKVSWWKLTREGRAPAAVPLGPQARAWVYDELVQWVNARIADRDQHQPRSEEMRRRKVEGAARAKERKEAAA